MLEPLSPAERQALDAVCAEVDPPPDVTARVRARVVAGVQGGAPAPRSHWTSLRHSLGSIATFVLGGITGALLIIAVRPTSPAHEASPATTVAPTRVSETPRGSANSDVPEPPEKIIAEDEAERQAPSSPPSRRPAAHTLSGSSQLAAERRLLDAARAALVAEDAATALRRLAEHQARFPTGFLAEERDAIAVQALVKARRYDEARERARAFRARNPDSLFAAAVDSALASIP